MTDQVNPTPENISGENLVKQDVQLDKSAPEINATSQPTTIDDPVFQSPVVHKKEEQTAKHTTMNQRVEPADEIIGEGKDKDALHFFLGTSKAEMLKLGELIGVWVDYVTARRNFDMGKAKTTEVEAARMNFEEFIKVNHADKTMQEVEQFCQEYFEFTQGMVEVHTLAAKNNRNPDLTNLNLRATDETVGDIEGLMAGNKRDKFSMSDLMRRDSRRASGEPENFNINLRNSFIKLQVKRPDVLMLGRLITDIANTIKGYVRDVNGNSLTLSRAAGYKAIYRFIMDSTVNCSVKDTHDFMKLADNILLSDFGTIMIALTQASNYKGVDLNIHCLQPRCDWSAIKKVDLSKTVKFDPKMLTNEQAAAMGNILNGIRKYSREEITKLQNQTKYDVENRIYFDNGNQYIVIKQPTLTTYFSCFDYFVSMINPEIQNLRTKILDNDEYESAYNTLISSIAGCEYIHWISELHILSDEGVDSDEQVYLRNGSEEEFNTGIVNILKDNDDLTRELIKFVHNKTPLMTNTVIGMSHYSCPKCKKGSGDNLVNSRGITPFDPFMHFFTHTQLMIMNKAESILRVDTGALSTSEDSQVEATSNTATNS